jgi:hypothetical protein
MTVVEVSVAEHHITHVTWRKKRRRFESLTSARFPLAKAYKILI